MTTRLAAYNRVALLDRILAPPQRQPRGAAPLGCAAWERLHRERVALVAALGWGREHRPWKASAA